ncbi:hypothetical protein M404DRAFT_16577 [Pisolithus tinctorius Marx 270]|uniref:DDE-1 domain-containing protein n=1 Tax=Pisolithus tinctorius Marx 270 TaxID=870435 RepID=A0A0C3IPE3_PISTI|nr:hypothetical protein M404DRAFT_16577 [Pisolithus tinctorius Marx 270]
MLDLHGQNQKLPPAVDDGCAESGDKEAADQVQVEIDGLKLNYEAEYEGDFETDVDEEANPIGLWDDEELSCRLAEMVEKDGGDATWLPDWLQRRLRNHAMAQKSQPKSYKKGPDVMSKSECTQSRYWVQWCNQSCLDAFGFARQSNASTSQAQQASVSVLSISSEESLSNVATDQTEWNTIANEAEWRVSPSWSQDSTVEDGVPGPDEDVGEGQPLPVMEAWEEELDMAVSQNEEIHDWKVLQDQIRADLKKHSKALPLSQLPPERRGGCINAHSFLHDESVESHCCAWLSSLTTGQVTPRVLQNAVNTIIFPELGITPKCQISEQTALKKGVYMDGHEREDVVNYWRDVFLPAMAGYEQHMVHFEGPDLVQVQPVLLPGQQSIKAYYHDESCFHANDDTNYAWIIYPGANGDAWWTHENLLDQIKAAIQIHEKVNGAECQALFVFDNSSAHASLPPDALRALDMNRNDGGKQCKQHDTIIPQSNPDASKCGHTQKMTTPSGQPRGLQSVLEERGFDVHGLHAKRSPYWGWSKYRYRQVSKPNFAAAKKAAVEILDSCPVDVIQHFINHSYHFMSTYCLGLTGQAAEWAVSQHAMMSIEAVLAPTETNFM